MGKYCTIQVCKALREVPKKTHSYKSVTLSISYFSGKSIKTALFKYNLTHLHYSYKEEVIVATDY